MSEQECRILLDTWGARTAASPLEGREEADRLLRAVDGLGNPPALRARALAISGSSWRVLGNLPRAHEDYEEAERLYLKLQCTSRQLAMDEADLQRRLALLFYSEGQLERARDYSRNAIRVFQAAEARHQLGLALVALGIIELDLGLARSVETLSRACAEIDPKVSLPGYLAAIHNLVAALAAFEPSVEMLESCLRLVAEMRLGPRSRQPSRQTRQRQRIGKRKLTLADAMSRVLLGRIHNLLGQHEDARRVLHTARADLMVLGAPASQATASVELAECLLWSPSPKFRAMVGPLVDEALALVPCFPRGALELEAMARLKEAGTGVPRRRLQADLQKCRRLILGSFVAGAGQY